MSTPRTVIDGRAVAAATVLGTLGAAVLLVLPGLVGALKVRYGFADTELGYLSSGHLAGLTLGSAAGARLIAMLGIKRTVWLGLILAAAANLAAVPVRTYWPLLACNIAAGLGAGTAVAVCVFVLARSSQVDRYFGIYTVSQLVFGAIALHWMPAFSSAVGIQGMFALLSALFALSLLLTRYLPTSIESPADSVANGTRTHAAAWIALVAIVIYFSGQVAVWAYLELLGDHDELPRQTVASAIALSSLVGIAGPLIVTFIGARFGRAMPLLLGLCVSLAALYRFSGSPDASQFVVAVCLFSIAWNFCSSYQPGLIADADPSGRAVRWVAFATLAGIAIGPSAGALVLEDASFDAVLWVSGALSILGFVGFIPVWLRKRITP
jgi:predicted MFS family arabinose efflux permease